MNLEVCRNWILKGLLCCPKEFEMYSKQGRKLGSFSPWRCLPIPHREGTPVSDSVQHFIETKRQVHWKT